MHWEVQKSGFENGEMRNLSQLHFHILFQVNPIGVMSASNHERLGSAEYQANFDELDYDP
jgi:hypothetical protein